MANDSCKIKLQNLLAMLRAVQIVHHTAHWQVKGPSFAGDHELFAELYSAIDKEFDTLAEKIVAKYGGQAVDSVDQMKRISTVVARADESSSDLVQRSLNVEEGLQTVLESVRDYLRKEKDLSMGLDNFLQGLADSHETAVYKLQQRAAK
jgi:starvation-inducible DNA-binding protein